MPLLSLSLGGIVYCAAAFAVLYVASHVFYNLFLHPLRGFPGPLLMRASRVPFCHRLVRGTLPFDMLDLHRRYGPVVRVAPDELAFGDPAAWRDIMGHRAHGEAEMEKWEKFYRPIGDLPADIVSAGREEHGALRRQLAHGFSDRSMRAQQPIIRGYVDLLVRRLRERCEGGKAPLDMAAWYNYTTFDVIGDLAYGESFGCLDGSDYHPWVRAIFKVARVGTLLQTAGHFPVLKKMLLAMIPKRVMEERQVHLDLTRAKLQRRMEGGKERPDLIEGLLRSKDELNLTMDHLQANGSILIIGGSETTATLLSGVTFLLLTNPAALARLTAEVRSAFRSEADIDFASVSRLPYLLACLDEALRMYPPVPTGLPRVVPRGGAQVCGYFVPEGTIVAVHHWAMYHDAANFHDPFSFHPERWLPESDSSRDPRFARDRREAFQPFHLGARNCIGKNLAYIEMRLVLARVLWNFDVRIADDSRDWMARQRIYILWEKGPLNVFLVPVERGGGAGEAEGGQ